MRLTFENGDQTPVAIITGAARGLGRAWSVALASRGVRVVVNDNDKDQTLLQSLVREIEGKGGSAVADFHSVEDGEKTVDAAYKQFRRIDILVNNATVIRDGSFRKMTKESWDQVYRSSLYGAFVISRAVWPIMREQKYGRILNCVSGAGLYGNFGQVNYAATKMGLVGFTTALNREGIKYNIHVNAISPVAGTRLTESVMPTDVCQALKPELTSPIVVYLCHPSCPANGELFEMGGGWVGKLRLQRTQGVRFPSNFTPEVVAEHWQDIVDFGRVTHPTTTQESFEPIMRNIASPPSVVSTSSSRKCDAVFTKLRKTLQTERKQWARQINGVMEWHVSKEVWTIALLKGQATVVKGKDDRYPPELRIYIDEQDFLDLASGKIRLQQAMWAKKLRLEGNLKLAMKLQPFADLLQSPRARL